MEHTFEFIAKLTDGRQVHMHYKGKSSRHSKVTAKILQDLKTMYNVSAHEVGTVLLKPVKK